MEQSKIIYVNKRLIIFPEGPIGFDGLNYRYSKGERFYIDQLAKNFKEVVIVALVLNEGDDYYETVIHSQFEADNLRIFELPKCRSKISVLGKLLHFLKIFFVMRREVFSADIFYLFLPSYISAMAWTWAVMLRKEHIVYGADDWEQASRGMFKWPDLEHGIFYNLYCKLNRLMEKGIVSSAIFAVAAGGQLVDKYKKFGTIVEPTTPRMVLSEDDIFIRQDTCGGEYIHILNVGSLNHDKAQHILIHAFSMLVPKNPRLRLTIIGSGERKEELVSLSVRLGLENLIDFKGYVQDTDMLYNMYKKSDIFVLSSISEGFPRVIYEALTMGLPVITTSCGGIGHLIFDGINGLILSDKSAFSMANSIDDIIHDSHLRKILIQNGVSTMRHIFNSYDHQQIARMYLNAHGNAVDS